MPRPITFTPGELPIEIIEEIVAEAWKSTSSANERQKLYSLLKEADTTLADVIGRVAIRYITFAMPLRSAKPSGDALYSGIFREMERTRQVDDPVGLVPSTADQRFRASHLRLEITSVHSTDMTSPNESGIGVFENRGGPLYSILDSVSTITLATQPYKSPREDDRGGLLFSFGAGILHGMETLFGLLGNLSRLTSLCLEYDLGMHPARFHAGRMPPVVFAALTFLRTRTCPCCGLPALTYNVPLDRQGHAAECAQGALARMFPKLRELQLDAPLFLQYLVVPPTLESITLDSPPPKKLFCSIQTYNVAAGLRRWMEPRQGAAGGRTTRMGLKRIVVRTGRDEPIGWRPAQVACDKYGVAFVREVFYV
ncbi:hypothetical protein TRAPUB_3553 [Trametes pubescens]|uniref:Uncharacterized protein n=1 Tax=Trametes pubescens TaxID=154538 RepID=A0A1M2VDG1_TRAPU|nr:hypothetical protein TRAPUB_3553 [Trametes pubescens]